MSSRREIRDFLVSRRARLTPQATGLPSGTGHRRVPGLRREEVAVLAGVSIDYYVRLERGDAAGVSDTVLDQLGRALRLDAAERHHLHALMRGGSTAPTPPPETQSTVASPSVQRVLDSMRDTPAFITNSRLDVVATNRLAALLYADLGDQHGAAVNLARYTFLDARAAQFYPEWDAIAEMTVALLRTSLGQTPGDVALRRLIDDLSDGHEAFDTLWDAQRVQRHTSGRKRMKHSLVGDLELSFDSMSLASDPTLTITVYTADEASPSGDALRLLAKLGSPAEDRPDA